MFRLGPFYDEEGSLCQNSTRIVGSVNWLLG